MILISYEKITAINFPLNSYQFVSYNVLNDFFFRRPSWFHHNV